MAVISLIRSKYLFSLVQYLNEAGTSVRPLLDKAKLPIDPLDDPEKLIPSAALWRFRELAAHTAGSSSIVIDAEKDFQLRDFGDFGKGLMGMPTLHRMLTKFIVFSSTQASNLIIETRQQQNGDLFFFFRHTVVFDSGKWHSTLYVLQWMLKLIRIVDPDWSPRHTWIGCVCPAGGEVALKQLALGLTSFGHTFTGFLVPRVMLALPVATQRHTKETPTDIDKQQPAEGSLGLTYASTLRQALLSYIDDDWLSIEEAAEIVGSSVRTMQRRLGEEGTTYRSVVDSMRAEVGAHLLESTDAKISEIAAQLGYSNQANFTRAFLRWAGVPPVAFRRARQHSVTYSI